MIQCFYFQLICTYIIIVFVLEPRRTRALRCALLTPSLFSSEVVQFLLSFSLPIATPVQKIVGIQNQD
ncbi:unnamed protein product [Sphagnum tenellum]